MCDITSNPYTATTSAPNRNWRHRDPEIRGIQEVTRAIRTRHSEQCLGSNSHSSGKGNGQQARVGVEQHRHRQTGDVSGEEEVHYRAPTSHEAWFALLRVAVD